MVDLKNSRLYDIQDRNNIQNSILSSINILNKIFKNSIEKEVKFSAGDEIQGLFISPQSAYLYYRLFFYTYFSYTNTYWNRFWNLGHKSRE